MAVERQPAQTGRTPDGTQVRERERIPGSIAIVFSGQGLSKREIIFEHLNELSALDTVVVVRNVGLMEKASGLPLSQYRETRDESVLGRTDVVQAMVHAAHLSAIELLNPLLGDAKQVKKVAGHSAGEIAAKVAAGVLTPENSAQVMAHRGGFMHKSAEALETGLIIPTGFDRNTTSRVVADTRNLVTLYRATDGAVAMGVGVDDEDLEIFQSAATGLEISPDELYDLLQQPAILALALSNEPTTNVIGGTKTMLAIAKEVARKKHGARRVQTVDAEGAFHTPAMREASLKFGAFYQGIELHEARFPVVMNQNGQEYTNGHAMRNAHIATMTQPAEWVNVMAQMTDMETIIKVGPSGQVPGVSEGNGIADDQPVAIIPFLTR